MSKQQFGVLILFVFVSGIVYFNSLNNGFHFDDFHHITENKAIRELPNIPIFFIDTNTFSKDDIAHYRPLLLATYAVNYDIGRLNPAGYHIVNLSFHAGSAFLVFLTLSAMAGASFFTAFAAGIIFLVHPFNSEVVNYITARSSVMSGFFGLMSFYFWVRFRNERQEADKKRDARRLYLISLSAFSLGMLSKESVLTLPAALVLYDLLFMHSGKRGLFARLGDCLKTSVAVIPFLLIVAAYFLVRTLLAGSNIHFPAESVPLHIMTGMNVLSKYIILFFAPFRLSMDHAAVAATSLWNVKNAAAVFVVSLFAMSSFLFYRKSDHDYRLMLFYSGWFFVFIFPVLGVVLESPLQENRGYMAAAGFAVFSAMTLSRFSPGGRQYHLKKTMTLLIILILCSAITIHRNRVWANEWTLWEDTAEKYPDSWRAHYSLGKISHDIGLENLAAKEYMEALRIRPDYFDARFALGLIYMKRGELALARETLERAVEINPSRIEARLKLGEVYHGLYEPDLALREFVIAVRLGELLDKEAGMIKKAREFIRRITEEKPGTGGAYKYGG